MQGFLANSRSRFLANSRSRFLSNNSNVNTVSAAWRDRLQQWTSQKLAAESGNPSALTDMGYAYHKEQVPSETENVTLPKSIPKAIALYKSAADQGYAPASSLLADIYYYGEKVDHVAASIYLNKVLSQTSTTEPDDAYIRTKSEQKLGVIAHSSSPSDKPTAIAHFNSALQLSRTHLKSNWAFILDHDPPGLWENLESESKQLDDVPSLQKNFSGFFTPPNFNLENPSNIVALRSYTLALRELETADESFAMMFQLESLETFGANSACGSWGVTYLSSFFKVIGNAYVQKALSRDGAGGKFVVLGSALGAACVWPAAMLGFKAVGYDMLDVCVKKSNQLVEKLGGEGGERVRSMVRFERGNCLELAGGEIETDCDVVWSNCYSWDEEAQEAVENLAFQKMSQGAVLILYREPKTLSSNKWSGGARIHSVATSWNPGLAMFVLQK